MAELPDWMCASQAQRKDERMNKRRGVFADSGLWVPILPGVHVRHQTGRLAPFVLEGDQLTFGVDCQVQIGQDVKDISYVPHDSGLNTVTLDLTGTAPRTGEEPSEEDIKRYALKDDPDEATRILYELWGAAIDLLKSADYRDADGLIPEDLYMRIKAGAIKRAREELGRLP